MRSLTAVTLVLLAATTAGAQTIYPINRADILTGAQFDLKVEFADRVAPSDVKVTINSADYVAVFGKNAEFIEREDGKDQSSVVLRDVTLAKSGTYQVRASDGTHSREITWNVYDTGPRQAKNVILFIGDGSRRIASRRGFCPKASPKGRHSASSRSTTCRTPRWSPPPAAIPSSPTNSMSAYMTGHKSAVNAMGGYADRSENPFDDPKVETLASVAKRKLGVSIGIVTNTEVEDATPAAVIAHTRRRATYDEIVEQFLAAQPDVLMGGGSAHSCQRVRPAHAAPTAPITSPSSATPATAWPRRQPS